MIINIKISYCHHHKINIRNSFVQQAQPNSLRLDHRLSIINTKLDNNHKSYMSKIEKSPQLQFNNKSNTLIE